MAGSIPQDFIREIVDTTDIVSLIDGYLPLKRKGKDHWGICPFCDDGKNPSFSVSEQKQFFYCFKCRATGNVIGFLQSHQGFDFVESIEALASKAGLEVPYESSQTPNKERDPLLDCMKAASEIFEKNLNENDSAEKTRKYIRQERKISPEICKKYSIGYSLNSWDSLSEQLKKKGFSEEILIKAGLAKKNKEAKLFDVFRDRLMFPIKDRKGRVVGFGGRVMNPDDQPKYLNTGDTPIFQKGKELYGLFEALEVRRDLNKLFVVEGYMDTVAMSEHGLRNSVATLGIATNRFHVQKLLQLVNEIIFCFDGDDAGRGAAWGALKNVLPAVIDGTEIKFLFLPEGEDPASLLEKESVEDFKKRINEAKLLSEYFIEKLTQTFDVTSLEKKASLASKAMGHLSSMQESSIKKLLESEVSSITGLDKDDIKTHSQSSSYKRKSSRIKKDATETKEERVFQQTGLGSKILNVILAYPFLASEIKNLERFEGFREPEVGLMIEVAKYFLSDPKLGISDLLSNIDPDSASFIGTLISTSPTIEEKNALAYLEDCLSLLKKSDSISRIIELKEVYKNNGLSEDETFELQQHLLSNIDKLEEPERKLLRDLSQKTN
ncbi:MAG TPA: DNA primase [SAR86 cluster bacterium]|jgi:DNA primase|nr:DNA primase [SAR86 cluster bacterium]HJM14822.1 DNA primase [SAR86 cluster bacterium]|tara:strand:+ start:4204 stop:6027 length:1824 start_codon:yes stop_codon:yes gene_type:complete